VRAALGDERQFSARNMFAARVALIIVFPEIALALLGWLGR
jgi:hypothetical protein